jgi:ketosteroid isomerase-like protein
MMTIVLGALDAAEVAAIQAAREDMVRLALASDWQAFIQVYDEHTVVMPPNVATVEGHVQLRAFVEAYPKISALQIAAVEIDGRADLAFERGHFELTAGDVSESGSYLTLWRKQIDGSWKMYRDIWHSDQ